MQKTIVSVALLLALFVSPALAAADLKQVPHAELCDNGNTQVRAYEGVNNEGRAYTLEQAAIVPSRTVFVYGRYTDNGVERFSIKEQTSGKPAQSVSHEEFDRRLQAEAPNYYNHLHQKPNDCK